MIEVKSLRKSYKGYEALKGIDFKVAKGEALAILGANGAGKSTLLNILSTRLGGFSGDVILDGLHLGTHNEKIKRLLGVVFQEGLLDADLTVEENLRFRGSLYDIKTAVLKDRIERLAKMTGVYALMQKPYGKLSGGQRRRCDIARALLSEPKILLLDEPTTGLDTKMRKEIWEMLALIRKQTGVTVLLTTHYMGESIHAERMIVMHEGKIIAQGTLEQLLRTYSKDCLVLFSNQRSALKDILRRRRFDYLESEEGIYVSLSATTEAIQILEFCRGRYSHFEVYRGNMESAYLNIMKRGELNV